MLTKLELNDRLEEYDDKTLKEVIDDDFEGGKKLIIKMAKNGFDPSEEVLKYVRIKRIIGESTFTHIVTDRITVKENKKLPKDTMKLDKILKEINTLENEKTSDE